MMKAKQWLRRKSNEGVKGFNIENEDGGIAGSLVGLGYLEKNKAWYMITQAGKRWLGC